MVSLVDHLAVVFPFEKEIFTAEGIPTTFVGHPLLDVLETVPRGDFLASHNLKDVPILGLFPGSRKQEIQRMLPVMLEAAREVRLRTQCQPLIGAANLPDEAFEVNSRPPEFPLLRQATHGLMQHSHAAIVTSGTATVETALYETPMVIVYKASRLNYEIGKRLINVSHIGMPNILAGQNHRARADPGRLHSRRHRRADPALLPGPSSAPSNRGRPSTGAGVAGQALAREVAWQRS